MSNPTAQALFEAARAAMANSYSPYSNFPVGAAILTPDGAIHSGCNVENAAYPQSWCAETTALAHMVAAGDRRVVAVAVIAEKADRVTPCGGCRQKLMEFGTADTKIHLCDQTGVVETVTLGALLPMAFDLDTP